MGLIRIYLRGLVLAVWEYGVAGFVRHILLVGYHGEPKVDLFHNIRII